MATIDAACESRNWLQNIMLSFPPYEEGTEGIGTPDEMIDEAGQKAFKISTALGLIPGPLRFSSILPEVAALTKLQINLIYRIARYYQRAEKVNKEIVLLILANVVGVAGGESLIRKAGTALVVRAANARAVRSLAGRVGAHLIDTAMEKATGRWIPLATAPLFGYFSRSLTRKIGREAKKLFSAQDVTVGIRGA